MGVAEGHKAYLGFGKESTFGTAVSRTRFARLVRGSDRFVPNFTWITSESITGLHERTTGRKIGKKSYTGGFELEVEVETVPLIFEAALGSLSTSDVEAGVVYKHTITPSTSLPSLTTEVYRGYDATNAFVYEGCKVTRATLTCGLDSFLRLSVDMIAEDENRTSKSSPTFSTSTYMEFTQGSLTWGGSAPADVISGMSIEIGNEFALRHGVGSALTKDPGRTPAVIRGEITAEFDSTSLYDDFKNATTRTLIMEFTGDSIGSSSNEKITITIKNAIFETDEITVDDESPVVQRIPFIGQYDGTNDIVKIEVTNEVASY